MTIPDFQTIMLPLLLSMSDGQEHSNQEVTDRLALQFRLSESDLNEMLPSGKQTTFSNRVGWARTYLSKSLLLEMPRRSVYRISERGKDVLTKNPYKIDMKFLEQFPEYREFRGEKLTTNLPDSTNKNVVTLKTPEEVLEDAFQEIQQNLAQDILTQIMSCSPGFFERLVIDLLVKMGYGGSRVDAARAVGQSGDGGIDGIIDEDRLGLDSIYIQAKRWDSVVGRPEIQKFVGALMGKRARKGIFITTSKFSSDAVGYTSNIDYKIVLIDGRRLADFMIDNGIGVTEEAFYSLKRIDSDYFTNG